MKLILFLLLGYAALLSFMYVYQRKLMYHPSTEISAPLFYGLSGFSDLRITSSDGTSLQLWYKPAESGFPTIAYFHGNASHIGDRAGIFQRFAQAGFGVAALSYRGYGKSEGSPNEQGIYSDARAAMAFLTMQENIPTSRILLYGESLGTGVAVQMATEYDVAMLVLQAPYTSITNRAGEMYRFLPVSLLLQDKFDSLSKIGQVRAPLLVFHGERDNVIPVAHGKALFTASPSLKRAHYFPEIAHNDFNFDIITKHLLEFAREHKLIP